MKYACAIPQTLVAAKVRYSFGEVIGVERWTYSTCKRKEVMPRHNCSTQLPVGNASALSMTAADAVTGKMQHSHRLGQSSLASRPTKDASVSHLHINKQAEE